MEYPTYKEGSGKGGERKGEKTVENPKVPRPPSETKEDSTQQTLKDYSYTDPPIGDVFVVTTPKTRRDLGYMDSVKALKW